ncbi:XdhC/CoxI family protein [Methylosinus sp. R-45379]|uniref:XdhC family protein n=1 Tax=Methylosinus sp. R-45379 TaxID=980563 RepID=UPI0007C943DB|nr:XdhC family protein [Methylosinus sp. R-45379]OAI30584.1 XdhC/CoxI family protein [Methylosinus sp. R-45379]
MTIHQAHASDPLRVSSEFDILRQAERWRRSGLGVAIATVIETHGSAPRPAGSHLVVDEHGRFVGSVSAGCVEADVIEAALDAIADGAPRTLEFGVADEVAWRPGLTCGGRMVTRVEKFDDQGLNLLDASNRLIEARLAHVIATPLDDSGAPRLLSRGDPLEREAETSGVVEWRGSRWFLERRDPDPRLVIVGAAHVAQPLAALAQAAGFDVVVVDPRAAYATSDRFPNVRLDARWPDEALPDIGLDAKTAIAALTHDPKIDDPALLQALASACFYVGALGSKATHARRCSRLLAQGADPKALERVRAPIGLDIGALSPADIAVAVLGEIVLARRRKPLRSSLRESVA